MKQVVSTPDGVQVVEVPAPELEPGTVLVRTAFSCVSPGTELAGLRAAEVPLWRRVARDPRRAARRAASLMGRGVGAARQELAATKQTLAPMGYSASGTVLAVASDVHGFAPGDRVACAGAGVASHAEVLRVPVNLVAHVPEGVSLEDAAITTVAAIALQGVRRLDPTMGESFAVIGMGVLGTLTVQMLVANGCDVVAIDVDQVRVDAAAQLGALGVRPGTDVADQVALLTSGIGVDGVVITASTPSDEVVSQAFRITRKRGRVVLVGDVGLDLDRADMYEKELELRMSTSYGPGRYDRPYEEDGLDYPVGHVRWTENRNMQAVLRLLARGRLDLRGIVSEVFDADAARDAFAALRGPDGPRPLTVLLRYPAEPEPAATAPLVVRRQVPAVAGQLGVAVIGAGAFASDVHLPNLRSMGAAVHLRGVAARTPTTAEGVARRFDADVASTDAGSLIADGGVHAVIICTRHDSHVELALKALRAGKHVLVEKPLAIDAEGLAAIETWARDEPQPPLLLTGFNRRFSPAAVALRGALAGRTGPVVLDYRMNAGYLPSDHWVHGPQGGGRNLGEACHIYDLFRFLVGAPCVGAQATCARPGESRYRSDDNFAATLAYADGSIATLTYTALGDVRAPKERLSAYADGAVYELEDYRSLARAGAPDLWSGSAPDKGHRAELGAFVRAIREGGAWPIPLEEQLEVTRTALEVERCLKGTGGAG